MVSSFFNSEFFIGFLTGVCLIATAIANYYLHGGYIIW